VLREGFVHTYAARGVRGARVLRVRIYVVKRATARVGCTSAVCDTVMFPGLGPGWEKPS
jgi:hypothetical protein